MSRSVPPWVGAHDDVAIPPRVKVRLFEAANKQCQGCSRLLIGRDRPQFDHILALANGGQHAEINLQVLCEWCHKTKTASDVAIKSKLARVRNKHLGIRKPSTFPCSRDSPWRKKINGQVERR